MREQMGGEWDWGHYLIVNLKVSTYMVKIHLLEPLSGSDVSLHHRTSREVRKFKLRSSM